MSYSEKRHRLWTDTPDLCKDYSGVLREIVNRLKCKGDEKPAGEEATLLDFLGLVSSKTQAGIGRFFSQHQQQFN